MAVQREILTKYQLRCTQSIDSECAGGEEYSETKVDKDDVNPPILFVFGKDINGKLIYVK
ncbi:hypothetical protein ACTM9B_10280 [Lachnospiraceae bacterium HCP1S3_A10]